MSAISRLSTLASDLQETARIVKNQQHRIEHLERILRQAVMTHRGLLSINSQLAQDAFESTAQLWICGDGIRLLSDEGDLS